MLVPISELKTKDFSVCEAIAIEYAPRIKRHKHETGRTLNGFLYCAEGGMTVTHGDKILHLDEGALVYLPRASRHAYEVDDGPVLHTRIDFVLSDHETGKEILFSREPLLLFSKTPPSVLEILYAMKSEGQGKNPLREKALLLSLLAEISDTYLTQSGSDVLAPAMAMLSRRYTEDLPSALLAAECGISETHFRRLFRRFFGTSPTEYRHHLRIEAAKRELRTGSFSVSEVAEHVGYESVFYFSRVFKARTGVPPSAFVEK